MFPTKSKEPQRIAKLLARAGVASRREIERMITEGRIALDGVVLDTPATLLPSLRGVTVDGEPVAEASPARLFIFHKPAGVLTTERDPAGRRTIYDVLPRDLPRLVPVGRLDLNTEGLLLMTTDGELKRQLELPSSEVERTYRARAFGEVSQTQLEELIDGVEVEGVRYGSIDANLERRTGANVWIEMTLTEGKNREVRRVLEHLGLQVSRLIRVRYGSFILADLPVGDVGEVRQHDLVAFRKALKLPRDKRVLDPVSAQVAKPKPQPSEDAPAAASTRERRPVAGKPVRADRARAFRDGREEMPAPRSEVRSAGPERRGRESAGRPAREAEAGERARPRPARGKPGIAGSRAEAERAGSPARKAFHTRRSDEGGERRPPRPGFPRGKPGARVPEEPRETPVAAPWRADEPDTTSRRANAPQRDHAPRKFPALGGKPGRVPRDQRPTTGGRRPGPEGPAATPEPRRPRDEEFVDRPTLAPRPGRPSGKPGRPGKPRTPRPPRTRK